MNLAKLMGKRRLLVKTQLTNAHAGMNSTMIKLDG